MSSVAVVTGSASGIGLATARLAAQRGWTVVGIDIASARAEAEVALASGGIVVEGDVSEPDAMVHALGRAAGLGPVGMVVSSAGILEEAPLLEVTDALLERTLRVHLGGLFNLTRAAVPHMRRRGEGSIVAISSELVAIGAADHAHYVVAKSAIGGFVRAAARELSQDGIRVNAVAPGPVDTPLLGASGRNADYISSLPLGRLGRPDEVARAILDVAEWPWATGSVIAVNGGSVITG